LPAGEGNRNDPFQLHAPGFSALRHGGRPLSPPYPCWPWPNKPLPTHPEHSIVRKFGATGDGKTLDTDAVNRAIDAAAAAGGGMVVFPPGTYLCFSLHLKSHVHLHLQQGSTILAADSPLPGEQTGYHGRHLRCGRTQYPVGSLPGLWSQPLAQLASLGREHPGLQHHGYGPDLGQGALQRARSKGRRRAFRCRAGGRRQ